MFHSIYNNRRVLITGHTGFKGSWLALWLRELGAQVVGYALEPPADPNLFGLCGLEQKLTSCKGDVRDLSTLRNVFQQYQPEIVFHLAAQALVRSSYQYPVDTYSTNVLGTVNLLEACRHTSSVRAVVNVTSDKCYENREWLWGYREIEPMGGDDPYSSSKGCAELVMNAYLKSFFPPEKYHQHGVAVASVRAGNVIGGGDWAADRLIPDCIRAILKEMPVVIRYPDAIRPWQHVLEPLSGYLLLAQKLYQEGPAFSGAWNFGPDDSGAKPVKWIVERLTKMWGNNAAWTLVQQPSLHEAHYLKLDCSKAKALLGWRPKWNLDVALTKTIEWYQVYACHEDITDITLKQLHVYINDDGRVSF